MMKTRRRRVRSHDLLGLAAVLAAGWASLATSSLPARPCADNPHRELAAWTVVGGAPGGQPGVSETVRGCARLQAWVSKSGREGVGITVEAVSDDGRSCSVRVDGGVLSTAEQSTRGESVVAQATVEGAVPATFYVPLPFDNDRAWHDRDNRATVDLIVGAAPWRLELAQGPANTNCSAATQDQPSFPVMELSP
jgi:hypothetical protein